MPVKVIYENEVLDEIDPSSLDELIALNRIKKFLRSEGWATVATDPIRGRGSRYEGPEKRKRSSPASAGLSSAAATESPYFGCASNILDAMRDPFLILDTDLKVLSASKTFYDFFKVAPEVTIGKFIYDLEDRQWDIPALRGLLDGLLQKKTGFDNVEADKIYARIGRKTLLFKAVRLYQEKSPAPMVLLAIEDITQRREMEDLLESSETKYRELVQNVNSIILKMDRVGRITFLNKFGQSFFGYTEEEILGRSAIGTIVPETDSAGHNLASMIKNIGVNSEKYIDNENENMCRNGERVWVVWTNKAIRDRDGQITEILCIGNNITERKLMENKQKAYEERFRQFFETSPDGLLLIDRDSGVIVNANSAIAEMLGYPGRELIGKNLLEIGLLENIDNIQKTIHLVTELGFVHYEDTGAKTSEGRRIDTEIFLVDRANFIQCNVRNIAEYKRTKEALAENIEKLTAIAESSIDAIIMINEEGIVSFFNQSAERLFGYRQGEVIDRKLHDFLVSEKAREKYYEALPIFQMTGDCQTIGKPFELNAVRKDGLGFPIELSIASMLIRGKWHAAGTVRDITERKRTEKEIQALNEQLKAKVLKLEETNLEMEAFDYSVSHDLRAPVRIIGGLVEIVLKDYHDKLDDSGKKLLDLIQRNTKRMDQLIEALLNLSRIEKHDLQLIDIDMDKKAALIAEDLKATAPERNIAININEMPASYGDDTLMLLVLTNLMSNAVKFTRDRDPAVIEVGGWSEENENIYYVKDNGAGFNMEYSDKLFRVFQRLHSQEEFDGSGIGLSIVQRVVRRHGGRVWAEGKVDEGSTFYFTIPRVAGALKSMSEVPDRNKTGAQDGGT